MEKNILKERSNITNIKKGNVGISSPLRSNKENENVFSPDLQPNIKSISIRSNEIQLIHYKFCNFLNFHII